MQNHNWDEDERISEFSPVKPQSHLKPISFSKWNKSYLKTFKLLNDQHFLYLSVEYKNIFLKQDDVKKKQNKSVQDTLPALSQTASIH